MSGLKKKASKADILAKAKEPIRKSDICVTCHRSFKWTETTKDQCWWCETDTPNTPTQVAAKANPKAKKKNDKKEKKAKDCVTKGNDRTANPSTRVRDTTSRQR